MFRLAPELAILCASIVCHSFASVDYFVALPGAGLPSQWTLQFICLAGVSAACSLVACLSPGKRRLFPILALQFICLLLIRSPTPAGTGIELLLGAPLVLEVALFLPAPAHLVAGPFVVAALTLFRKPPFVWGQPTLQTPWTGAILLGTLLTVILALALLLRRANARHRDAQREIDRLDEAIDRISDVNASFQDALTSTERESSTQERRRITREIHDIVGYTLTNQQMMIEACLLLIGNATGRLKELLLMAREGVAEGLQETRTTLYALRSIVEGPADDLNLILKVARNFERVTGVRVTVEFANVRSRFEERTRLTLHRLIQESLINAMRHGKAGSVSVIFWEEEGWLTVTIHDDGRGATTFQEGIGLKGMRERVAFLGGELVAGNYSGGFEVRVRLPTAVPETVAAV